MNIALRRLLLSESESLKSRFSREGEGYSHTEALQRSFGEPTTFPTMGFSESPYRAHAPGVQLPALRRAAAARARRLARQWCRHLTSSAMRCPPNSQSRGGNENRAARAKQAKRSWAEYSGLLPIESKMAISINTATIPITYTSRGMLFNIINSVTRLQFRYPDTHIFMSGHRLVHFRYPCPRRGQH